MTQIVSSKLAYVWARKAILKLTDQRKLPLWCWTIEKAMCGGRHWISRNTLSCPFFRWLYRHWCLSKMSTKHTRQQNRWIYKKHRDIALKKSSGIQVLLIRLSIHHMKKKKIEKKNSYTSLTLAEDPIIINKSMTLSSLSYGSDRFVAISSLQ